MATETHDIDNRQRRRIKVLPKEVVDRIAAGEIVQGPSSVAKELIENSLDAECSIIEVQCASGGLGLLSVSDDGKGIHPDDFQLAVTRFATSKLVSFDDLKSIQTFGFRGEALASTSMVSRLTIISKCRPTSSAANDDPQQEKVRENQCAYKQSFADGKSTTAKPTPIAGNYGTLIKVEDLFYNIPSRRRAFDGSRKESEEYHKVLLITQRYAIHKAREGIGFICKKHGGNCDLNTSNITTIKKIQEAKRKFKADENDDELTKHIEKWATTATKDAISHIFGPQLVKELLFLESSEGDVEGVTRAALQDMKNSKDKSSISTSIIPFDTKEALHASINENCTDVSSSAKSSGLLETIYIDSNDVGMQLASASSSDMDSNRFAYRAIAFMTNGTYCVPKASSAFILFINDRLVESASLRRALENIYTIPKGVKPFVYLALYLPGPLLDVNIHPTKREVAYLHMDLLCEALVSVARKLLFSGARTFQTQSLVPVERTALVNVSQNLHFENNNAKKPLQDCRLSGNSIPFIPTDEISLNTLQAFRNTRAEKDDVEMLNGLESANEDAHTNQPLISNTDLLDNDNNRKRPKTANHAHLNGANKHYDPKNLIRIVQQQGSLEPYLTIKDSKRIVLSGDDETSSGKLEEGMTNMEHLPFCEFSKRTNTIDLNIPGAFASICRCQIGGKGRFSASASEFIMKPKTVIPTSCNLVSVRKLRSEVTDKVNDLWTGKLREAIFVGCVSRHRSLLQCGVELVLVHHTNLARELFYQLALTRFAGAPVGFLDEGGVNVQCLIEYALQFEEDNVSDRPLNHENSCVTVINEINKTLASQATQCLAEKATMLKEYFSICLESKMETKDLFLVGLPVLLDGFSPSAHYIPVFLLRLATEIDWTDETCCFDAICTELAYLYAEIPYPEEEVSGILMGTKEKKIIQHVIFPAVSTLLQVPNDMISDGSMIKVALLSQLYKVFERC